ncbi:HPr family phosphocarrier protein [uncultured Oscillibacter sp.]|uniref:HPr family phosphocarrier protein n=1 Tax=uncultured Oscillibacter sp. TaxID=876091 RepID=UPI00262FAA29|nr:HPr family phosphocarrier protein [uncultured Oscillibacter sp.]
MKQFTYTIQDHVGIHARPAGMLAREAKALDSVVTVEKADGKSAAATKLMAVMSLGVKCGDTVTVKVEGGDEAANAAAMEAFFKENL